MNVVAIKFDINLMNALPVSQVDPSQPAGQYARNQEKDETILEEKLDDLRHASSTEELGGREQQHDEVEAHRVDEQRRQPDRIRMFEHAASAIDPASVDYQGVEEQAPVSKTNNQDSESDKFVLCPHGNTIICFR